MRLHEAEPIRALLRDAPVPNLFLLGMLERKAEWYGDIHSVAAVTQGLIVPWSRPGEDPIELLEDLRPLRPDTLVGPRAVCDALIAQWGPPLAQHDQRLYVLREPVASDAPVRQATLSDADLLLDFANAMELEDFGRLSRNEHVQRARVEDRIREGRSWVMEEEDQVVFTVNVGTQVDEGCQVGGTYVPPSHRGRGVATRAMGAVGARLLTSFPVVTLHVREANTAAVRAYRSAGFERDAPFRVALYRMD